MNRTFTQTDLILFAYNETELTETALIVDALETDYLLQEEFSEIVETMEYLENMVMQPADKSVDAILKYSRSLKAA